eukprot:CAMPEP_0115188242 /NCGR_PEP_ID=MMETSP0270-20121206/10908_1 /TAXON_ID=71861 /ORGANISM="Scrippsiella trochoidea, Strain CCMP3099" /LENGTH=746 /DNA_ID=CAMNT_0002601415 /DNA_START=133 /DNA_END=2373 /DNA_ORIENTATION=+
MAEAKKAAQEPPQPVVLQPGQVISGHEIIKPLGKGKFSIVYMAKRLSDGFMCALKKINIFDMLQPKQREKCLKEVRILQSLDHPNIVKLLEAIVEQNELLIIVDWAEKGDLKRIIRKAQANETHFKEPQIWEYSKQLAGALDHMHSKRVMHRDIKPANIFVAQDGSLKLGDLGLGRLMSSETLEAFSKVGTPLYMSPEVLHGAGYDMKSDVWSLGCVMYELVMLRSPFKSEQQLSLYDLFVRISKGQYPPLSETCSQEFRDLVDMTLRLEAVKRPDSAQVLAACVAHMSAVAAAAAAGTENSNNTDAVRAKAEERKPTSRPSPLLVMDDIVEKLKLLECEERLLRPRGYPLLHRCFFTQRLQLPGELTQFEVMFELCRWLFSLFREREAFASRMAAASPAMQPERWRPEDVAELTEGLLAELSERGIPVTSETTKAQLHRGYGEGVCLILNEVINQELLGRDFHFEGPVWGEPAAADGSPEAEEVEDEADLERMSHHSASEDEDALESEEECSREQGQEALVSPSFRGRQQLYEPIHIARVDEDAWKAEVQRVRPSLKVVHKTSDSFGGWRSTISTVESLCQQIADLGPSTKIAEGINRSRVRWREELENLQGHEERLNRSFASSATELARFRDESAAEVQRMEALHSSITQLSGQLTSASQELEKAKSSTSQQCEQLNDDAQLARLRKSLKRLKQEDTHLAVRVACLQQELDSRRHTKTTTKAADAVFHDAACGGDHDEEVPAPP